MSESVRTVFLDESAQSVELRADVENPDASFADMLDFYRGRRGLAREEQLPEAGDESNAPSPTERTR